MNSRSIRFRLIAWYASLFGALVAAFGIYSYQRLDHYLTLSMLQFLEHRAERIAGGLLSNVADTGGTYVGDEIKTIYAPEANDRFIRVTRTDGTVIYMSGEPIDKSFDPKEIRPVDLSPKQTVSREEKLPSGGRLLVVSLPFHAKERAYVVEVGSAMGSMDRVLRGYLQTLLIGLPVVGGVAIIGGFILMEGALLPVKKIILAARKITPKDLNIRLPVENSGDEIEALSKTLNQMIARLEDSFQSSNRFTSDASHELRTPLTIIQGELEALLLDNQLSDSLRAGLGSLLEEAERLGKIVEGLLSLSRLDAGAGQMERTRFDLGELVGTTSEQMCLLAEEKAITVAIYAKEPVVVDGDKGRLKQVVVNLLDNAIKYTPTGGKVDVYVTARQGRACLEVVDNGSGIRANSLPFVFDRFYRAVDRNGETVEGAGLGLSIVKSICTAHGGSVTASNAPGNGCRIAVEIPLAGIN